MVGRILALAVLAASPAVALQCSDREIMVTNLKVHFQEDLIAQALSQGGYMVETFVGPRSWTILRTAPDGESCIMTFGEAFDLLAPLPGIEG